VLDAAAAAAQVPAGTPILFIDTCSLLDIPRVVERARKPGPEIDAAQRVLAAARGPTRKVALFIAEVVLAEWATNMPVVVEKLTAHVIKVEEDAARIAACGRALGHANLAATKLRELRLPHVLLEIAEALLQEATVIEETQMIRLAAFGREIKGTGPARKGKQCLKDCTIAESLLRFTEELRPRSPAGLVFLTSNTEDFSDGGSKPHPDLQGDFVRLAIQLNFSWGWAAHSLGL
jgi:PIN domain